MKRIALTILISGLALSAFTLLPGCTRQEKGAAIGAGVGAGLGAAVARTPGAVIGGVSGAVIGSKIAKRRRRY